MSGHSPHQRLKNLICLGLGLITLCLYLPALSHGFVEYDDQQYVTENPQVQAGLTWRGVVWAFGFHAGNWHPLAWLSHMLDCQLYGARAWGHHLTSVLLHAGTTVLLFLVLNRMTSFPWRSAAVAALFAWHPLHVESVAWVAERKDVLCAFFWMATLWLYARYAARPGVVPYLLTLGSFALCLMAKPMGVTLPFVLWLLDYWPLNRMKAVGERRTQFKFLLLEKVPLLLLSAFACGLTLRAQEMAIVSTAGLTLPQRIPHVLAAYNHYVWAMFYPHPLAVYYPYVIHLEPAMIAFSGIVLGAVTLLAAWQCRRRPYLIVGWLWFLGTLVPVIGLVQVGDQAWADRYTYIPLIGLFVGVVWAAVEFVKSRSALITLAGVTSLAMLAVTCVQLSYWKNTWTLFDHANQVTPGNYMALTVLGSQLAQRGKLDEAMALYHRALSEKPGYPQADFFLGNALEKMGRLDESVAEYEKALWFKPTQEQTHIFLGIVLARQKNYAAAITNYEAALALNPDSAVTHNNLARIYQTQGRFAEGEAQYSAALKINPQLALAHNNLGILLLQRGDLVGGTTQLRSALQLNPTNSETILNLASALSQQAKWPEAADLFSKTVHGDLPDPKAHYEFAMALAHLNRTREAMGQYAAALLLQPDFPDALDGLAWILSTAPQPDFRNGTEAVKMAFHACELTGNQDPAKLKTLAAAYAESGNFEAANKTIQTAMDLAARANHSGLAGECSLMLKQFQMSKPWRSP